MRVDGDDYVAALRCAIDGGLDILSGPGEDVRLANACVMRHGNHLPSKQLVARLAGGRAQEKRSGFKPVARKEMLPQLGRDLVRQHQGMAPIHWPTSRQSDSSTRARWVANVSCAGSQFRCRDHR